ASLVFFLSLAICAHAAPQTPQPAQVAPTRDPQAVSILSQALAAAGGVSAVSVVQDFTGTGTITYYWANQEVSGQATVRGLGTSDFRLDAQLPQGARSWLVTALQGATKNVDGTTTAIQYSNA